MNARSAEADFEEYPYDDERFNKGVEHVVDLLAKTVGASGWTAGDGSEDYDEDLAETLRNILAAKGLYDKDSGEFADKRIAELTAQINTPETADFQKGIPLEAAHQRERWGSQHDAGKQPLDWFWLIGYLAQKAATSAIAGDIEKAKHHTISTAAALSNWHLRLSGGDNRMRPGIAEPEGAAVKLSPMDQANLIAGHAVAAATAFLGGRHDVGRLSDNADRLFLDLLVVEAEETSSFLIPVQLLAMVMMRTARCAMDIDETEERLKRWQSVMGSLVELVCHESRQLKKD